IPIGVKLKGDNSRGILAPAYIRRLDLTVDDELQDKYRPASEQELIKTHLESALRRGQEIGESRPGGIRDIHSAARGGEHEVIGGQAGDPDAGDRADLALRDLKAAVDRLALETEAHRAAASLDCERQSAREIVSEYGDADAHDKLESLEVDA